MVTPTPCPDHGSVEGGEQHILPQFRINAKGKIMESGKSVSTRFSGVPLLAVPGVKILMRRLQKTVT
jgi:hypothetical protein